MNILIINSSKTAFGGLENQTLHLARALSGRGHAVLLGCAGGSPVYKKALESGVPVEEIAFTNAGDPVAVFRLLRAIHRHKPEVVVATMGKEYWPVTIAAKMTGRKAVLIRHMADPLKKLTRRLVRAAVDNVIAVSGFVRQGLIEAGLPDEKISVVHNGIETGRFAPRPGLRPAVRAEFHFSDGDLVIGAAGALNAGKGLFVLLEAASLFQKEFRSPKKVKVLLAGEGEGRPELGKKAAELGVEAVFAGRRLDMDRVYQAMDIFVFPSVCRESFGMVVIEAMAAGLPVIASSVGGVPEIVKDGENGILVAPGDPRALARAMELAAASEGEISKRIAAGARESVEAVFSSRAMAARFEAVLKAIMP
ncbi:MAG: glycosyltransferase family 4 protein [Nitrospiraceae bacterium]|nr:glycosyltransferase family 4 protein [Nitrospiraceae bacterium]